MKIKLIFLFFLMFFCLQDASCQIMDAPSCLSKSNQFFNDKDYDLAQKTLQTCLAKYPKNPDMLISLGGVQMILQQFDKAEASFKAALKVLGSQSKYHAYINSLLGDIAIRRTDIKTAAFYYDEALKFEPANINALVGRGICEERLGRGESAAALYRKALAVDYTNLVARERLIILEPEILTKEEVLFTMKERNLVDPVASDYTDEDYTMLTKLLNAEENRAIEYLAAKYKGSVPDGFLIERDKGKVYARKMLTLTGYKEVLRLLSLDAQQDLIDRKVDPSVIYSLRDKYGNMMYDKDGILTDEGLIIYSRMLKGQKTYYLPSESDLLVNPEVEKLVKKYLAEGYEEISTPEYIHLMNRSRCSENTLVQVLGIKIIVVSDRVKRIFVVNRPNEMPPKSLAIGYIVDYRQRTSGQSAAPKEQPVYTSFFGMEGNKSVYICDKLGRYIPGGAMDKAGK